MSDFDNFVDELNALRADNERLREELLLISQLQAGDGSTINGLTKDQLGRAFRQAQDIARAALGGTPADQPSVAPSETCMEQFEVWAETKGMRLDQLFLSTWGVPENPYEDSDTRLAYEIWLASRRATSPTTEVPHD